MKALIKWVIDTIKQAVKNNQGQQGECGSCCAQPTTRKLG